MNNTQTKAVAAATWVHAGWASIAKKTVMAISGAAFILFVIGHMVGNWQLFMGPEVLNAYAVTLRELGPLLWAVRAIMFIFLILHVWTGIRLYLENRWARPIGYQKKDTVQASLASRTMIWSGLGILLYVVYHVLHFTLFVTNPHYANLKDANGHTNVYAMVVDGFSNYWISGVYILAMAFLAYHLSHAVPSMFQTVGWNRPQYHMGFRIIGVAFALFMFIGYSIMPVAVLAGWVTR
jgi:succinate dehydrogenase / fumarate reductase cytochrome b subunit